MAINPPEYGFTRLYMLNKNLLLNFQRGHALNECIRVKRMAMNGQYQHVLMPCFLAA